MRTKQELLTAAALLLAALMLATCAHQARRTSPVLHRVAHNGQNIAVDLSIDDAVSLLNELQRRGMSASAIWNVPGASDIRLALIEKPATETSYGPQLVALQIGSDVGLLHESPRLYDDNFVVPTFYEFSDRTLMLADHGSEDAYGILAWSIEAGEVRDLGQLQIALPAEKDVFTRGAAPTARVELKNGRYVITIPGPVLLHPQGTEERLLAKEGEVVTFNESAGKFELAAR